MKYILLCGLLAACNPDSFPATHYPSEEPSVAPTQKSIGKSVAGVQWTCTQEDVSDNSVWISCDFKNTNAGPLVWPGIIFYGEHDQPINTCVSISYVHDSVCTEDNPYGYEFVVLPKKVCSGELPPGQAHTSYASFYVKKNSKEFTNLVSICGRDFTKCNLHTTELM